MSELTILVDHINRGEMAHFCGFVEGEVGNRNYAIIPVNPGESFPVMGQRVKVYVEFARIERRMAQLPFDGEDRRKPVSPFMERAFAIVDKAMPSKGVTECE